MSDTLDDLGRHPRPLVAPGWDTDVRALDSDTVLDQILSMRATADSAEARLLELAVHYVDLHPATPDRTGAWAATSATAAQGSTGLFIDDQPEPLAGAGTPAVADYAIETLGGRLGVPYAQAFGLAADAVALCYRLPRLYAAVQAGHVPAWKGRFMARETLSLSRDAADYVDRQLALLVARHRWPSVVKLRDLVHEAALLDDPDHEQALEETALAARGVWFDHHNKTAGTATTSMTATLDAWDALHLDNTLSDLAGQMGRLGDTSTLDTRRAHALTLLTHPQQLLDLTTGCGAPADTTTGGSGTGTGTGRSTMNLYVHATLTDLADLAGATPVTGSVTGAPTGCALVERFGPALLPIVATWAGRTDRIIVRPVLDPTSSGSGSGSGLEDTATRPVDRHDPPAPMREHVILCDGACVFPGCQTDARGCDLDHISPYRDPADGGPPGQTHAGNLAPLCRRHHRLKTHTSWDYRRDPAGTYTWTTPSGRTHTTHPTPRRAPAR